MVWYHHTYCTTPPSYHIGTATIRIGKVGGGTIARVMDDETVCLLVLVWYHHGRTSMVQYLVWYHTIEWQESKPRHIIFSQATNNRHPSTTNQSSTNGI